MLDAVDLVPEGNGDLVAGDALDLPFARELELGMEGAGEGEWAAIGGGVGGRGLA